jgi:2-polyprenyl-6-methoxyphenol hydroxylase-like FAD-dependent oxidoreductase
MPAVVRAAKGEKFDTRAPLLIVGAGAAGLCAALAAKEAGADVVVLERDAVPAGSTALSAGLIPAAGTRFQHAKGISDGAELFAADIQRKAKARRIATSWTPLRGQPVHSWNGWRSVTASHSKWSTTSITPGTQSCGCMVCRAEPAAS